MKIEKIINEFDRLIKIASEEDNKYAFQDPAYELIDDLEESGNAFDFVEPIFRLIEKSPDIDFGGPGPFGSFLEKFYHKGYEEKLLDSLNRNPKKYTIFLLSRLCNDSNNPKNKEYKSILSSLEK
ncbi:hypothetical protein [Flavobacterium tyrosinilyticum]|uniref:hypothetical protein n=1 Tax=Flavobacterium tyrosinilyticum TaxID=1658740 RepID=UPI00202E0A66|nr:hypothetical protein [Flavobacterium tyrosinilyticum]MCM0665894.1 hypothetical protein [Flavobacterium tyrosinilyticum]